MHNMLDRINVKIYGDGADLSSILELRRNPLIRGFTTNPTLMRAAGVTDYEGFARALLSSVPDAPISFEVFTDDFAQMEEQALKIASWGDNVFVKIPVTNTHGDPTDDVIRRLSRQGVQLNVTALMTLEQVARVAECLDGGKSSYVSVFAGRIADTGRDPVPLMSEAVEIVEQGEAIELIWASPREILNIFQADSIGCHIITVTHDLLAKLASVERDLDEFSLATVRMFHSDAAVAGYQI